MTVYQLITRLEQAEFSSRAVVLVTEDNKELKIVDVAIQVPGPVKIIGSF